MPYCCYLGEHVDTVAYLRRYLEDSSSRISRPAAVIVETIQIHGGVNVASEAWLKALEVLCREFGILLIVDDSDGLGAMWRIFRLRRCQAEPRYDPCLKRNRRRDPDFALASQARAPIIERRFLQASYT